MRRRTTALVCLALAACPAPPDTTPLIPVVPGKAGLWNAIFASPSSRHEAGWRARVHAMRPGEELGGPNAIGRPGDFLLENDEVAFVIDQLGLGSGFAEGGGNLVDAADALARKDELGQLFTYFGKFPRQAVYMSLESGTSPDGSAWLQVEGHELLETSCDVVTRYTLRAGERALRLETTVRNTAERPVQFVGLGDAIEWGGTEKVAPGLPWGFTGRSQGPFVGGVGRFVSYASTSDRGSIEGTSGTSWTDTLARGPVTLAPGEQTAFRRMFVVGKRPDSASLTAELARVTGAPALGSVEVQLAAVPPVAGQSPSGATAPIDSEGPSATAIAIPADARLEARRESDDESLSIRATGQPPTLTAELPPGRWRLSYLSGGGRTGQRAADVVVDAGRSSRISLPVTAPSGLHAACLDAAAQSMPCKLTFERTDGGAAPDLGPPNVSGPAKGQVTSARGIIDLPLAPGAYRVTASRGPEYALSQQPLVLAPGQQATLRFIVPHVVDTSGYLACDFHQHSMLSADSGVGTRDRIVSNVAEGVEVAVATEHNVIADLEPIVRELGVDRELVSLSGDELTSDASQHPWGHANAFPLTFDPGASRGGAPAVRDRLPGDVWTELRRKEPTDIVIQVNHPRSVNNGYFELVGFDAAKGVGPAPSYDASFDALEVWNGRNVTWRERVLLDFLALLRTGHPVTPTANTDTHGIVGQEAGYPRTYVHVANDEDLGTWSPFRTQDLVRGVKVRRDVVLTNGPMLRVEANGAGVGDITRGPEVLVRVHVESAPWVVVDQVEVLRASAPDKPIVKAVAERLTSKGSLVADATFRLTASSDDAFVVIASGTKGMTPVLGADPSASKEISPWAMTGALWIDADGDGRALGR